MTNAQKWVAAFLVLFIVLFILSRNALKEEINVNDIEFYEPETQNPTTANNSEMDGLALLENIGCTSCHGGDLKGTRMAPSLYIAKEHFDRSELINYLRNPADYSNDPRFDMYQDKYKGIVMPSYSNIDVKKLGKIADYLLMLQE
ncbi:MAG: cytochrome c [Melioribacteraceae bacterium]|nr:cytochrome c [Melioribacteraceae bacterium]